MIIYIFQVKKRDKKYNFFPFEQQLQLIIFILSQKATNLMQKPIQITNLKERAQGKDQRKLYENIRSRLIFNKSNKRIEFHGLKNQSWEDFYEDAVSSNKEDEVEFKIYIKKSDIRKVQLRMGQGLAYILFKSATMFMMDNGKEKFYKKITDSIFEFEPIQEERKRQENEKQNCKTDESRAISISS